MIYVIQQEKDGATTPRNWTQPPPIPGLLIGEGHSACTDKNRISVQYTLHLSNIQPHQPSATAPNILFSICLDRQWEGTELNMRGQPVRGFSLG